MPEIVEMTDDLVNSEVIWTFLNVKKELIDSCPTGTSYSDILKTINGQSWKIDFYPNGKDKESSGCVDLLITFLIDKEKNRKKINANCYFMLEGIGNKRLKYAGYFQNKSYESNLAQIDSSIQNTLLEELQDGGIIIAIGITELLDDTPEKNFITDSNAFDTQYNVESPSQQNLNDELINVEDSETPLITEYEESSSTKSVFEDMTDEKVKESQTLNDQENVVLDKLVEKAVENIKKMEALGLINSVKTPDFESVEVKLEITESGIDMENSKSDEISLNITENLLLDKMGILESNSSSEICQLALNACALTIKSNKENENNKVDQLPQVAICE